MDSWENIINLLNEAIIETDAKGFIKEASPAAADLCGYKTPEDLKGIHMKTIYAYPETRDSIIKKLEKEGGFFKNFEFLLKQKDGTTRHTICNIRMLRNSKGEFAGTLSACRDISERKESEKALLESQKNFKDLIATKDKFFSIISHDLRSPLSAILNFSELALKKLENKDFNKATDYCKIINDAAKQEIELLNNLLDWSRLQTSQIDYKPQQLKLDEIVKGLVNFISANAFQKDIEISKNIPENLIVFGDKNMLDTILRNLISNAIKFTENNGQVKLSAIEEKHHVRIEISDNGVGMTKEELNNLFQTEQIHSKPGTRDEKGSGLGLILCKDFIEKHSGEFIIKSEVNKGTTFSFTIPHKTKK